MAERALPGHTWRLTFAYDGDKISLERAQRVAMIAPPTVTPPPDAGSAGYWLEVRDKQNKLVFHRPLHNPTQRHIEQFGEKPGDLPRRLSPEKRQGQFDVLVPDMPNGAQFSVHGAPVTPTSADPRPHLRFAGPADDTTLARHSFDDIRKLAKE